MGSSGFRVPSRTPKSGFQWVPGSGSEPKKWVPVGSGFQVGTQKVGSGGFRVPTKIFLVPDPGKNIIFHDLELDQNINDDIEIAFYRFVDTIHLLCQSCGLGILNNEFFGRECILCHDILCVCDGEEFQFYRIKLSSVPMRTQEVIEIELRTWEELSFVNRRHMVRTKTLVNQIFSPFF